MKNVYEVLSHVDVNKHTEKKKNLTYLSWAWAVGEVKKKYPNFSYEIYKDENNLPYVYDQNTGYMVFTKVTIEDLTHEMWLPVMDGANKAMKSTPYTYTTKYGEKTCEAATMFDINKTIMRCLVKNLGMFGLGLYIYAGEDLPNEIASEKKDETNYNDYLIELKTEGVITDDQNNAYKKCLNNLDGKKLGMFKQRIKVLRLAYEAFIMLKLPEDKFEKVKVEFETYDMKKTTASIKYLEGLINNV